MIIMMLCPSVCVCVCVCVPNNLNHLMNFYETGYEYHTTLDYPIFFNILPSVMLL